MKWISTVAVIAYIGLHFSYAQVRQPKVNIEDFVGTEAQVTEKIAELERLIKTAKREKKEATKEKLLIRLARVFLLYANWDEDNKATVASEFDGLHTFHETTPEILAEHLPTYERSELILLLNDGIRTLSDVIDGTIVRTPVPTIDWSKISYDGNRLLHKGRPVFLSDYSWKEERAASNDLQEYFGAYDGHYMDPAHVVSEDGSIAEPLLSELKGKKDGTFGTAFIGQARIPDWLKAKHPEIEDGAGFFTKYDIDNPGAHEVIEKLFAGTIPLMKGKMYTKQGYMLTNEPHFNISGDWEVVEFSEHSKDSLRAWLRAKHTSIKNLNDVWKTDYPDFEAVEPPATPISPEEQGTPIWYDVMRFNQERVTDWFTFMNAELLRHDPEAQTHIKLIPEMWTDNSRYQGLDFEALTDLTANIGNDAGAKNSLRWGGPHPWEDRYAFLWRELSMSYDFFRSVSPDKVNFNSEAHFIQHVAFSDLFLEPSYVRSVYWLAIVQGMNATKSWFWPRDTSGALKNLEEQVGGSVVQQPRVAYEIAATFMDANAHAAHLSALQHTRQPIRIFYSETSAINKAKHMDEVFELYESAYFEGLSIGFATEKIIERQLNSDWDVVLVHKTEYVTRAELNALQAYLDGGGLVIIDAVSLRMNEYGQSMPLSLNTDKGGTLISASEPDDFVSLALEKVSEKGQASTITIEETNAIGKKGCVWRTYKSSDDGDIVTIVNIGKTEASLTLGKKGGSENAVCTDLLTGKRLDTTFSMPPESVYLLSVK